MPLPEVSLPLHAYVLREQTGYAAVLPALGLTAHAPTWWAVRRAMLQRVADATGLSPDTDGLLSWAPERRSPARRAEDAHPRTQTHAA